MTQLLLMRAFQKCCKEEFQPLRRKPSKGVQILIKQGLVRVSSWYPHLRITKKGERFRTLLSHAGLTGWYSKDARELEMFRAAEVLIRLGTSDKEIFSYLDTVYEAVRGNAKSV